jgi:hypothetical protein
LLEARLERPLLEPGDVEGIRRVILSHPDFDPRLPGSLRRFCQLFFQHEFFVGRGEFLLRWLGVSPTFAGYVEFLARVFPNTPGPGLLWLERERERHEFIQTREELELLGRVLVEPGPRSSPHGRDEGFALGWRAISGGGEGFDRTDGDSEVPSPEAIVLRSEQLALATHGLRVLSIRNRRVLAFTYGLAGMPALPPALVAQIEGLEPHQLTAIVSKGTNLMPVIVRPGLLDIDHNRLSRRLPPFQRGLPIPRLWPLGGRRHSHSQSGAADFEDRTFYASRPWRALPQPLKWDELLARLARVLHRLALPAGWLDGAPKAERWSTDGTEYDELQWSDGDRNLQVLAIDGWRMAPDGSEEPIPLVFACLAWDQEFRGAAMRTEICLMGVKGEFQGLSIEGDHDGRIGAAWRVAEYQR